jgi:oligoendopeptidase F
MRRPLPLAVLWLALAALATPASAVERSAIPEKYTWALADIYPTPAAWAEAKEALSKRIPSLKDYRGHLGDSSDALYRTLSAVYAVDAQVSRLSAYASMLSDQDTREAKPREMRQAADQVLVDFSAATSWLQPEILAVDPAKLRSFIAKDKRLAEYRFFLEDTLRGRPHTLNAAEEHILAEAGALETARGTYTVFKDAELPYPTIKLSTGAEVRLDSAAYTLQRASPVREDRDKVFAAFFGAFKDYRGTLGSTLYAHVQDHIFVAKVRHFDSALQSALFRDNIPTSVYQQLLKDVHQSLPTLHRYLKLRQRMMGLDSLRYQDLYAPLVAKVNLSFTPEEARALTLEAVAPLGKTYVEALKKGFESRWTDYLPSPGKAPGAYSTGVYGLHPFQLLNFNGKYEDLTTLAHESGHSMHTYFSYANQPYATSNYAIFVAEVASTLNENLLLHFMLDRAKDDATRLSLLGTYLDGLRTTLFRQTLFAEFELRAHEMVEHGETLTGDNLSALYLKLVREYYGSEQGICRVDDIIAYEWEYIPHFYANFYVYQYATSLVASTSLAKAIRAEAGTSSTKAVDAYLTLLKSGGSDYPVEELKKAGVDMTTSVPFQAAMAEMNSTMDQMEKILAKGGH